MPSTLSKTPTWTQLIYAENHTIQTISHQSLKSNQSWYNHLHQSRCGKVCMECIWRVTDLRLKLNTWYLKAYTAKNFSWWIQGMALNHLIPTECTSLCYWYISRTNRQSDLAIWFNLCFNTLNCLGKLWMWSFSWEVLNLSSNAKL